MVNTTKVQKNEVVSNQIVKVGKVSKDTLGLPPQNNVECWKPRPR